MPLQEPSQRESELYYCGLPSHPKLIARSSTTPWPQLYEWVGNKKLGVATGHAIEQPWNDPRGTLQQLIIETLSDIDWTAIDILRVGYIIYPPIPGVESDGPVTILISVSPNSTTFHQAEAVIVSCKEILARFALDDVEVEVKESIVTTAASIPTAGQQSVRLESGPFNNDIDDVKFQFSHDVSEYIGTSIGVPGFFKGTKGLYLQGQNNKTYALTCRHVLFPKEVVEYRYGDGHDIKEVMQPALSTSFDIVGKFSGEKSGIESGLHLTTLPMYKAPEFQAQRPILFQKQLLLESCQAHVDYLEQTGGFTLGRVENAPRIQLYSQRVRDWALIELSQESFTTSLSDLTNKLPVTQLFRDEFKEHKKKVTHGAPLPVDTSPEVKIGPDLIPEAELKNTFSLSEHGPQCLIVAKFGCNSGLTFGRSNSIQSVRRHPSGAGTSDGMVSNEWCILGAEDHAVFSKPGDSGACVFDLSGRIGGIVTAGLGAKENPKGFDVTYATPMEWLLEDIKRAGYDVKLPK